MSTSTSKVTGQTSASAATDPPLSVVIPVYNEAENIPILFEELRETAMQDGMAEWLPAEIIWVEDGSDDGTGNLIDDLAREHDGVRAIHLRRSWGQSAALAAGIDAARGDVVVPMDGDLQNDPADIPRLLAKLEEGYDCVSGRRCDRDDPWHKTIPSAIQTALAKYTGPDINDFGCTLKAYRAEALEALDLRGETHRYLPAQLYDKGYSITEIGVNHRPREHGDSRYGVGRLVRGFVDLIFHWFWVRYSTRPLHLLGGAGFAAIGTGGLIGLVSVIQKYAFGVSLAPRTPRLVLVALLIIFGLQLLVFGFLAEMLTKLHYREDSEYRIESTTGFHEDITQRQHSQAPATVRPRPAGDRQ